MAIYYIDPVNGTDTQTGGAPVKKTGCQVTSGSAVVVVPNNTGLVAGMKVFATDMENSGALFAAGTTISSISGNNITISAAAVASSASATVIFSPAKKLISGIVASLTAGDVVRIKQSPSPENTTLTASWVNGSNTITGSFPISVIDNCETAFTAVSGKSTCSVNGTYFVQGSNSAAITSPTNGGSGVIAYKPVSLNLSGYSRISLMAHHMMPTAAGQFKLNLCSDSLGQVPVYSGIIPLSLNPNPSVGFTPVVIDVGQDMTTPINSISIERTSNNAVQYILYLDNIVACKGASDPTAISHRSLLSKSISGEEWYAVRALSQSSIVLGLDSAIGYSKSSYTGTLYEREPNYTPYSYNFTIGNVGTELAPITISGGWNSVDMSTQPYGADSMFLADRTEGGITVGNYCNFERFGTINNMVTLTLTGKPNVFTKCQFINGNSSYGAIYFSGTAGHLIFRESFVVGFATLFTSANTSVFNASASLPSKLEMESAGVFGADDVVHVQTSGFSSIDVVANNSSFGGRNFWSGEGSPKAGAFSNCTFDRFTSLLCGTQYGGAGRQVFRNCKFDFTNNASGKISSWTSANPDAEVRFDRFNQVANDHRIYKSVGTIQSHSGAYRHTASGISWAISPSDTTNCNAYRPLTLSLAKVAVTAGTPCTASVWVYRSAGDVNCGIRVKAGDIAGMAEQKAVASGSVGSWQQVNLTFTPPASGVVEVEAFAYGTTSSTAYFDDFSAA